MGTFFGNSKGIGIVEVLAAGGAAAVLAMVTSQVTTNVFKAQKSVTQTNDISAVFSEMNLLLQDKATCARNFGSTGLNMNLSSTTRTNDIVNAAGTLMYKTDGTAAYMNNTLRISGWRFEQSKVISNSPYKVTGMLTIDFLKSDMAQRTAVGGSKISRSMAMSATLTGPGGTVVSCSSAIDASMPSYWDVIGSDMYNNNSGRVGIGTSTPTNKLTVVQGADGLIIGARNTTNNFRVNLATSPTGAAVNAGSADLALRVNNVEGLRAGLSAAQVATASHINMPLFALRVGNVPANDRPFATTTSTDFVLSPALNRTAGVDSNTMYLSFPGDLQGSDSVSTRIQESIFISNTNSAGNGTVGIGGVSAYAKLHVYGGATPGLRIDSSADDIHLLTQKDHLIRFDTGGQSNNGISFWNNAGLGTIFKIASNGRVGINQPNPAHALDVNGAIAATGNLSAATLSAAGFCIGGNCRTNFAASVCGAGSVATTFNADGTVNCTDVGVSMNQTGITCPAGFYLTGIDAAGNPMCAGAPSGSCPAGQFIENYNLQTGAITCRTVPSQVTIASCPAGQYLYGISNGTPLCAFPVANTNCAAGQKITSIVNGIPSCGNEAQNSSGCAANQKVTGFNSSGVPVCANEVQNSQGCGAGQSVTGFGAGGNIICADLPTLNATCGAGQKVIGFNASGAAVCAFETQNNASCSVGQKVTGFDSNGAVVCGNEAENGNVCPANQAVTGFTAAGVPICSAIANITEPAFVTISQSWATSGSPCPNPVTVTCDPGRLVRSCSLDKGNGGAEDIVTCSLDVTTNSCTAYVNTNNNCDGGTLYCHCSSATVASCSAGVAVYWNDGGGNNCSGVTPAGATAGAVVGVSDGAPDPTGTGYFECLSNGSWNPTAQAGSTCTSSGGGGPTQCSAGATLTWTVGPDQCQTTASANTNIGATLAVSSSNGNTGTATFTCGAGGTWNTNPDLSPTPTCASSGGSGYNCQWNMISSNGGQDPANQCTGCPGGSNTSCSGVINGVEGAPIPPCNLSVIGTSGEFYNDYFCGNGSTSDWSNTGYQCVCTPLTWQTLGSHTCFGPFPGAAPCDAPLCPGGTMSGQSCSTQGQQCLQQYGTNSYFKLICL